MLTLPGQSPRCAGILLHPTSLPGPHGTGDLGAPAHRFVDWLADAGMTIWQVLPLVPPGACDSPYSSQSALSGSPWLIDLATLREDGLLAAADLVAPPFDPDRMDPAAMRDFKRPRLSRAARNLLAGEAPGLLDDFERFRGSEPWVLDAALFAVVHEKEAKPWWQWAPPLRDRDPGAVDRFRAEQAAEIDERVALQFLFDRQWRSLRARCRRRGIRLLGDVPIYVDEDSVDVWANREQFQLGAGGRADPVAGVPPDYFAKLGQLWGNPLYDWSRMRADGFRWWVSRLERALGQCDVVRIDHFRGLSAYWAVPAGAPDARSGHWVEGPGIEFFDAVRRALGDVALVAEDLGDIDEQVHQLRREAGLPGMKVLQFAFGGGADNEYLPHNHRAGSVVYTGTHDNDTTLGWWSSATDAVRDHVRRYLQVDGHDIVWDLIASAWASVANTAIIPMQDALALRTDARMNTPGETYGNWTWRVRAEAFNPTVAARLRTLAELYDRLPRKATRRKASVLEEPPPKQA